MRARRWGVAVIGISSNDSSSYPADSPEQMVHEAQQRGYRFPYLYDETQEVAKAYHAACTPDFYVFDKNRKLVYRGQFDGSRPDSGIPVSGTDLRMALDTASPVIETRNGDRDRDRDRIGTATATVTVTVTVGARVVTAGPRSSSSCRAKVRPSTTSPGAISRTS